MILLLRIFEIDHELNANEEMVAKQYYWGVERNHQVNITNAILDNSQFLDLKNRLEEKINPYLASKEEIRDSCLLSGK